MKVRNCCSLVRKASSAVLRADVHHGAEHPDRLSRRVVLKLAHTHHPADRAIRQQNPGFVRVSASVGHGFLNGPIDTGAILRVQAVREMVVLDGESLSERVAEQFVVRVRPDDGSRGDVPIEGAHPAGGQRQPQALFAGPQGGFHADSGGDVVPGSQDANHATGLVVQGDFARFQKDGVPVRQGHRFGNAQLGGIRIHDLAIFADEKGGFFGGECR